MARLAAKYTAVIHLKNYFVNTTNGMDVISVIHEVNRAIKESSIPDGVVIVTAGCAVTVIEPLPEIISSLKKTLMALPCEWTETKNTRGDEIGVGPRVLGALVGKSLQLPLKGGKLIMGPREEVVIIDMEKGGLRREFYVQVSGDTPAAQREPQRGAPPRRK